MAVWGAQKVFIFPIKVISTVFLSVVLNSLINTERNSETIYQRREGVNRAYGELPLYVLAQKC